jgi:hypothetical protein
MAMGMGGSAGRAAAEKDFASIRKNRAFFIIGGGELTGAGAGAGAGAGEGG